MNVVSPADRSDALALIARERARRQVEEERRRREAESPDGQLAGECARDLRTFIREAWPIVEPAAPFVASWHIDCVAEHLMAVSSGEIPRLIINQPPRTTKSLTAAVFWPAWEWLTRPHIRWLFASYAQDFAYRDSMKMRRVIKSLGGRQDGNLFQRVGYQGVLRLLGQSWELVRDQDAKSRYETTETGVRFATGVGGSATGEGGDRIVIDDPLNARRGRSDRERAAANVWWDETMSTRFNNRDAAAVIVMQRLHEQDLSGHLLAKNAGWHHLCLPAEYNPSHPFVYPAQKELPSGRMIDGDPRTEPGQLLDPDRLDPATLDARRRDLGSYGYAGQYDQNPVPAEGGMFKRGWWRRRWQPGFEVSLHLGWDQVIQSWDLRFGDSQKASSSFVVGQVWGFHGADAYLLAQVRGRFSFTETVHVVRALTAFRPDAARKLVERKANGEAVMSTLRRELGGMVPVDPRESKDARAAAITPWVEGGNVILPAADTIPCPPSYIDEDAVEHPLTPTTVQDFIEEAASFPLGSHDDQVDAMSQAISWAKPSARLDPDPREGRIPGYRRRRGSVLDGAIIKNAKTAQW